MVMTLPLKVSCVALKFIYLAEGKFCRSYWKEESEVTAELDKLQLDLVKATKSLDHATPGVLNSNYFTCSFVHITDCYRKFSFLGFALVF